MKEHEAQHRARLAVEMILQHELEDYSHFSNWEIESNYYSSGHVYIGVTFPDRENTNDLHFRVDAENIRINDDREGYTGTVEISLYEDNYEEIEIYDNTIKHLWMALLTWN